MPRLPTRNTNYHEPITLNLDLHYPYLNGDGSVGTNRWSETLRINYRTKMISEASKLMLARTILQECLSRTGLREEMRTNPLIKIAVKNQMKILLSTESRDGNFYEGTGRVHSALFTTLMRGTNCLRELDSLNDLISEISYQVERTLDNPAPKITNRTGSKSL